MGKRESNERYREMQKYLLEKSPCCFQILWRKEPTRLYLEGYILGKTVVLLQEYEHGFQVYAPTTQSMHMDDVYQSLKLIEES